MSKSCTPARSWVQALNIDWSFHARERNRNPVNQVQMTFVANMRMSFRVVVANPGDDFANLHAERPRGYCVARLVKRGSYPIPGDHSKMACCPVLAVCRASLVAKRAIDSNLF
jgi:hypothetical protein